MFKALTEECHLYHLGIQRQLFDEEQLDNLCVFIDSQNPINAADAKKKSLIKLTLQWLRLQSTEGFTPLLECLGRNRKLRHVNISWNNLLLHKEITPLEPEEEEAKEDEEGKEEQVDGQQNPEQPEGGPIEEQKVDDKPQVAQKPKEPEVERKPEPEPELDDEQEATA